MINTKNRRGQMLIIRFVLVIMSLIGLYFVYQLVGPVITLSVAGQSNDIQVLEYLIVPGMILFFLLYMFKQFKKGES